ncbi:MAG: HEAT repeat domain-containing protein [Halobacteriota archaeon]|uniref:HEAT repeat domain-containing protein n=1 Tax=Natronomonas sp. TaxID=2184060 RepID=UPI003975222A
MNTNTEYEQENGRDFGAYHRVGVSRWGMRRDGVQVAVESTSNGAREIDCGGIGMVFFTLKIIRFFFRLTLKIVLLPFKLAKLALGMRSGPSDDEYGGFDPDVAEVGESGTGDGLLDSGSSTGSDLLDVDRVTAARNIVWFRWGLLAVGVVQFLAGILMLVEIVTAVSGTAANTGGIIGGIIGATVAASLPILAAVALTRKPTLGWYAGMGLVGFQIVGSVFFLPIGLLWMIIYSPIAYLGYTGRPALGVVYGDESSARSGVETASASSESDSDADTAYDVESVERAESTATTEAAATEPTETANESELTAEASSTDDRPVAETSPERDGREGKESEDTSGTSADAVTADASTTEDADAVVEAYRDELTAADPSARARAINDLASAIADDTVPDQSAVDAVVERLDDDDPTVRSAACEALGSLGVDRAEPRLKDLRIDPDPEVSRAATRALRNFE